MTQYRPFFMSAPLQDRSASPLFCQRIVNVPSGKGHESPGPVRNRWAC
jgi:hypothetical protein